MPLPAVLDPPAAVGGAPSSRASDRRLVAVAVPIPVDEPFTYALPDGVEAPPGVRVEVPLGRRRVVGYVVGDGVPTVDGAVREVLRVIDPAPILPADLLETTRWVARRYAAPWGRVIEAAVPAPVRGRREAAGRPTGAQIIRYLRLAVSVEEARRRLAAPGRLGAAAVEAARTAVEILHEFPLAHTAASLGRRVEWGGVAAALRRRGLAEEVAVEVRRDPFRDHPVAPDSPPALAPDQEAALAEIRAARAEAAAPGGPPAGDAGPAGRDAVVVLRGVTGSGKTEVYLRAIREVLDAGGGAIVLVPEISLTPQTVDRFRARFGDAEVALLHSGLTDAERADEWRRLAAGEARIAVGARSALFAPVRALRLVVLDEEHETSYKQAEAPRYHAREAALARARAAGAALVLGTATPSLETAARAATGRWRLAALPRRIGGLPLPSVEVVDMRAEMEAGHAGILSRALEAALAETIAAGRQSILFLNRRGAAAFLMCRTCGRTVRCDRCDTALTLHARAGNLRCHFCEARRAIPDRCACGAATVRAYGLGTERVEAEVRRLLPRARVVRMDADTTVRRGSHREILGTFAAGGADILVGTQMIGKGLDLPRVALVGVVAAETSLGLPDFRAAERTFDLVVQVAGRTGRAGPGRVVVQTHRPDHPVVAAAARHDVEAFVARESAIRRASNLPPFADLVRVVAQAPQEEAARDLAEAAAEAVRAAVVGVEGGGPADASMTEAAPAPIERIRGMWRWAFFVRRPIDPAADPLAARLGADVGAALRGVKPPRGARLWIDVDPLDVL